MMKRILSVALIMVILMSVLMVAPIVSAAAASGKCGDNVTWSLNSGIMTISGSGKMNRYVGNECPWYGLRDAITEVLINDGVTNIAGGSFDECSNLAKITIPFSVEEIGDDAFFCARSLKNVTIPNSVTRIGSFAFRSCTSLESISIPDSVLSMGSHVFCGCTALKSVRLSNSIDSIEFNSFAGCSNLTNITIPEGVTLIGYGSFNGCSNLTDIVIPGSVTRISDYAFDGCTNLSNVYYSGSKEDWNNISKGEGSLPLKNAIIHFNNVAQNNELDFSRDVWNMPNFKHKSCSLEDELTNGYYKNPYMDRLSPSNRAKVKADLEDGAGGHCFGMSATVILQKIGLEDLTKWPQVEYLRKVGGMGVERSRICYYHTMQSLWDFDQEVQRFSRKSVNQQLQILAERAENVKHGGNPVLLCFAKPGWGTENPDEAGAHAVVAYALEPGSFVSSTTKKQYNRRVLLYDCNNVDWSEDYCLLYNEGTNEWEIPHYAKKDVSFFDDAFIMCASVDTRSFDAIDDIEQMDTTGVNPVIALDCTERLIMKNKNTGQQWVIDGRSGSVTGSSSLLCYSYLNGFDHSDSSEKFNVVLPDTASEYEFTTESSDSSELDISVLYYDKYLSVKSKSAESADFSSDGAISINGNKGEYEIVAANNNMQSDEKYDTFTISGKNEGDTKLSVYDSSIKLEGDNISGTVIKASNEKDSGRKIIDETKSVELSNEKEDYSSFVAKRGDTDGNGVTEIADATFIMRYLSKIDTPYTESELMRGDVDKSSLLELTDVTAIQYYLAGLNQPYPIGEDIYDGDITPVDPSEPQDDTIRPYSTLSCSAETYSSQTVTMKMTDNIGIKKYGVFCDPQGELASGAGYSQFKETDSDTVSITVNKPGRYYFNAEDVSGNRAQEKTIDFTQYDLEPNGGTVDVNSVLVGRSAFSLPIPARNNYQFVGWTTQKPDDFTGDSSEESSYNEFMHKKLYANWMRKGDASDNVKPTVSIDYSRQSGITLNMDDNSGIKGYYWGMNEDYRKNLFIPSTKTSVKGSRSNPCTYYLTAIDINGNVSETVSLDTDEIILNANGGFYGKSIGIGGTMPLWRDFAAISSYKTRDNSVTPTEPIRSGYVFIGWSDNPNAITGKKTITANGSKTYYAVWRKDTNNPKKVHYYANGAEAWGYDWECSGGEGVVKVNCYYSIPKKQYDFEIVGVSEGTAEITLKYKEYIYGWDFVSVPIKVSVDANLNVIQE